MKVGDACAPAPQLQEGRLPAEEQGGESAAVPPQHPPPKKRLLGVEGLHPLRSAGETQPAELLAGQDRASLLPRELQPQSNPSASHSSALNHQVGRQRDGK